MATQISWTAFLQDPAHPKISYPPTEKAKTQSRFCDMRPGRSHGFNHDNTAKAVGVTVNRVNADGTPYQPWIHDRVYNDGTIEVHLDESAKAGRDIANQRGAYQNSLQKGIPFFVSDMQNRGPPSQCYAFRCALFRSSTTLSDFR